MCGKNYQAVNESLPSNPKLAFNPKGVGKTICLLALWQEYIQSSTNAILLGVRTITDYLSCYHTNNYLKSLTIDLSNVSEAGNSLNLQIMKYRIDLNFEGPKVWWRIWRIYSISPNLTLQFFKYAGGNK